MTVKVKYAGVVTGKGLYDSNGNELPLGTAVRVTQDQVARLRGRVTVDTSVAVEEDQPLQVGAAAQEPEVPQPAAPDSAGQPATPAPAGEPPAPWQAPATKPAKGAKE